MRKDNRLIISIIGILILSIGVGYAYLTSNLSITGSTRINANTWDIHFNNIVIDSDSVSLATGDQAATIDPTDTTKITYAIGLNQPGDYYEFNVDIVNAGTINGMISTIVSKVNNQDISNLPDYLDYSIKFLDGDELVPNFLLEAGNTETIKVRIEFKEDIDEDDLLDTQETLNFSLQVNYTQARSNAVNRLAAYYLYTNNNTYVGSEADISGLGTTYNTYQEVVSAEGYPFFLRYSLKQYNNKVFEKSVGYVLDGSVYYLKGAVNEENLTTKPVYEANKSVLISSFGNANCTNNATNMGCTKSGLNAFIDFSGNVDVYFDSWTCRVQFNGFSKCLHNTGQL